MKQQITEKQIQYIVEMIKKGEPLPATFKEALFGKEIEKKEYELKYGGKEREEDVIANTQGVPLQKVKTFHPDDVIDHEKFVRSEETKEQFKGWYNKLIFGDNLQILKTLVSDEYLQKQIRDNGGIKLIYIDPPFATKSDFVSGKGEKAYSDKVAGSEFIEFIRKRLILLRELLAKDGSIFVHLDEKKGHYIKIILDEIFGVNCFANELIWSYTNSGGRGTTTFAKKHDTIFYYRKNASKYIFNPKSIGVKRKVGVTSTGGKMGTDKSGREYQEIRSAGKVYRYYLDEGKIPEDVLDIQPIPPHNNERVNYPTQKPEKLLEFLIKGVTNEGDIVLDAFAGSGTTLAVAEKLGRKWIGIDCGKLSIYTIQNRMMNLKKEIGNKGDELKPQPFAVYNAGLYNFKILTNLDWDTYTWFTLTLFQCDQKEKIIDGVRFDGLYKLDLVQVFDYNHGREGISLDKGYLENLVEKLGNKLSKRTYIITPASRVDFLETSVTIGSVEFVILRVPYSLINEMHKTQDLSKLHQPKIQDDVNNTVDAVGFDFMQPPRVEVEYLNIDKTPTIQLNIFTSKVISKKPIKLDNLESLSMIIVDYEYNDNSRLGIQG